MDVRQLDMFRGVVEEGTFTKAALRLHVTQSAISRQVKLLEDELGGELLHRGARGVTLTYAGELLLTLARRVHGDMLEVVSQIGKTHKLERGSLRLGGGMTVCTYVLPRLLKQYRSLYKHIDLRVTSGTSEVLMAALRRHELDVALLTLPIVEKDLDVIPVLKEEMVVVTAPRHPLARERSVDPRAVARFPLIVYESGSNTRKIIDQFFLEEGVPVEVAMETENVEIIKAMVGNGLGITVVPYASVAKDARAGRFACLRIRGRRLFRETGWVHLKSDYVPRTVTELLRVFDAMKEHFGGKPPRGLEASREPRS